MFFGEAPEEEVQCFDKLSTNGCGEVREFVAKQNAGAESFLASEQLKGENTPEERAENEAGMEEMSRVYEAKGKQLYLPEG